MVILKKNKFIFVALFLLTFASKAQTDVLGMGEENGSNLNVLYRNDASFKIFANTRGYGLAFRRGKHVTAKTRTFYEIEGQNLMHPKQVHIVGPAKDRKRFVYGKLNSVLALRGCLGMQHVIFGKADLNAVEVRMSYALGGVLAIAKPYYYQVFNPNSPDNSNTSEVAFNNQTFTTDSVIGRGEFLKGINQTSIYPGITGKFNLSFEYAPYTNLIRAIETGVIVDFFPKALPIMARNPAENFIVTLHVAFVFGKKWY
ncbi:MAG: hypothetical protein JSU07_08765 [Bacteroidetes bacterium]|nr:hypothetical protein [Bacteroidota bacterium]